MTKQKGHKRKKRSSQQTHTTGRDSPPPLTLKRNSIRSNQMKQQESGSSRKLRSSNMQRNHKSTIPQHGTTRESSENDNDDENSSGSSSSSSSNNSSSGSSSSSSSSGSSSSSSSSSGVSHLSLNHSIQRRRHRGEDKNKNDTTPSQSKKTDSLKSPPRKSPRKSISDTVRKIHGMARDCFQDLEYSDQDSDPDIQTFKATKKQKEQDDDSYRESESSGLDDGEDEDFDDDDVENAERDLFHDDMSLERDGDDLCSGSSSRSSRSSSEKVKRTPKTRKKRSRAQSANPTPTSRNINNDDIFDQEGDSCDDAKHSPIRQIELTPLKLKKRGQFQYNSSSDDDEKEIMSTPVRKEFGNNDDILSADVAGPKIPFCTSEYDEITNDPLPTVHVCYLAPDGKSRHCFCLDTLYKASILSGSKKRNTKGRLLFLQPPHFRTEMDDSLVDQIASRFGRQALVIEDSKVYKQNMKRTNFEKEYGIDNEDIIEMNEDHASFRERLDDYLNKQMGSGDIYCCPLCYCEAQRRFREGARGYYDDDSDSNDDDDDEEEEDINYEYNMDNVTSYSKIDPMSILGSLDHDEFEVASSFCFHRLSQVKNHLRSIHEVDIANIEVNDFLKRFLIRAQDGLLQRYLRAMWKHRIFAGAMRKYWLEGHNQNYILLRVLIDRREYMNEFDSEFVDHKYSKSFPRRAKKMWRGLSAPYSKSDESDFIDSGEEDTGGIPHPIFERPTQTIEEEFVEHLRKKRLNGSERKHGYDSSSSEDDEECKDDKEDEGEDDDDDQVISLNGHDEEDIYVEESSEDDWVASKRARRRKVKTETSRKGRLKRTRDVPHESDDDDIIFVTPKVDSSSKKTTNHLSSSEEESDNSNSSADEYEKGTIKDVTVMDESEDSSEVESRRKHTPRKKVAILEEDSDSNNSSADES